MCSLFREKAKNIVHKGKYYSIKDLQKLRDKWEKETYEDPDYQEVDKYAIKSLELTEKQFNNLKESTLRQKASSWKSRQRKLRKDGRLGQHKIDKLNELGMLWNPLEDLWEINYSYFKKYRLIDPIEKWVKEQRVMFKKNQLSNENFIRLNAANFPFEEKNDEVFKLDIYQIIFMEEQLNSGKNIYDDNYTERNFHNLKKKIRENKPKPEKLSRTQLNKIDELNLMTFDDFKIEIDELFNREYIYEREQGFIKSKQDHYSDIYFESFKFLNGTFKTGKTTNYLEETVKFKCSDKVILYVSEKGLNHIDKFMLGSGKYNDIRRFPPVNKLITYYSRNKMIDDLVRINLVIQKHPVLKAIYDERVRKILVKYNKV